MVIIAFIHINRYQYIKYQIFMLFLYENKKKIVVNFSSLHLRCIKVSNFTPG